MSAIGSVIMGGHSAFLAAVSASQFRRTYGVRVLPAALCDTGQFAAVRHLAHADPAQAELAVHRVRPPAPVAARVGPHGELRLARRLDLQGVLRHQFSQFSRKGKPSRRSNARPSSSVVAVVTTVMSIPRKRSILSWSISWNMTCSVRPNV